MEEVILVDEKDDEVGVMEKLEAHRQGRLHRAFSILLFDAHGRMLLQQRALSKYHSPGLWSNACCSHPRPGETVQAAVNRRLKEELGIHCPTQFSHHFLYRVDFDNGLIEHELDHVYKGIITETPVLNPDEASAFRYVDIQDLKKEMEQNPDEYTFWFHLIMKDLYHD